MKEDIAAILADSVSAPSPDNYQPWRFEVKGGRIAVFKVPGGVNRLLDYDEHVLLLTNGMLLENMVIAASRRGYAAVVTLMPVSAAADCIASITLEKTSNPPDALYSYLQTRCTNRKPFLRKPIDPAVLDDLKATSSSYEGVEISMVTEPSLIRKLGHAVSIIDRVMFENQPLHDSLFDHITWTREEEQRTHVGLNLDSMEFKPPEKIMFRALKNWNTVKSLNRVGFSKFVRFKNAGQYGSGAACVLAAVREESAKAYLIAGRCVQRLWLKATAHGLSLHPIVGTIYCYQKVVMEKSDLFSPQHAQWLRENYDVLREASRMDLPLVFFCRLGYAKPTSYQSTRKPADVKYLE